MGALKLTLLRRCKSASDRQTNTDGKNKVGLFLSDYGSTLLVFVQNLVPVCVKSHKILLK